MTNPRDALFPEKTRGEYSEMSADEQLDLDPETLEARRSYALRVRSALRAGPEAMCGKIGN